MAGQLINVGVKLPLVSNVSHHRHALESISSIPEGLDPHVVTFGTVT